MVDIGRAPALGDARHDFDFLFGRWKVFNRKLQNPTDPASVCWVEFEAHVETRPVLGGLGNIDLYLAPEFPERPDFEALALRLFDADARVWRIWWASTVGGGQLDTPVLGRFAEGRGMFESDDVIDGRELKVRYQWLEVGSESPRWEQSFSFDDGNTWQPNWIMRWQRNEVGP